MCVCVFKINSLYCILCYFVVWLFHSRCIHLVGFQFGATANDSEKASLYIDTGVSVHEFLKLSNFGAIG